MHPDLFNAPIVTLVRSALPIRYVAQPMFRQVDTDSLRFNFFKI